jgi:hypothetical protein
MMDMDKLYKIRNKETGQFSKGGITRDIWTKGGKTWTNIGHVKSHLNQFLRSNGDMGAQYPYLNAEIVEVEVDYDNAFSYDVNILVGEMAEAKDKKNQRAQELHKKWEEEQERKKFEELARKHPDWLMGK